MMSELTGSIAQVRESFAEVVDRASHDDLPSVITRQGKEVAAIVSIDTLRKFQAWEEHEINRIVDERMANSGPGISIAEIIPETIERRV